MVHRQVKYLNNVIEADHGKLTHLIKPVRGFKDMKTAYATIKGFEAMHDLRKGRAAPFRYGGGIMGEVHLIERQFTSRPHQPDRDGLPLSLLDYLPQSPHFCASRGYRIFDSLLGSRTVSPP